ncbi:hypothetical protein HNR44_003358 [Geomicrobium halophilum]|uniref:Uncharacterized protein n=1 Tax=Geomicrobium halophilum TaxID=549000 RepID=A0A841PXE3_9BACL|nr:hypothetical protein [Geomicrobium halophilum]MBB6451351.1 hypothetical protein [Geomicrobium halophilum]
MEDKQQQLLNMMEELVRRAEASPKMTPEEALVFISENMTELTS